MAESAEVELTDAELKEIFPNTKRDTFQYLDLDDNTIKDLDDYPDSGMPISGVWMNGISTGR